ncbi:MAG TPA: hypothetical protein VJY34_09045 [Roseiarcus sp.]|nr:hypothetical protein [Roseiarcus sp.]
MQKSTSPLSTGPITTGAKAGSSEPSPVQEGDDRGVGARGGDARRAGAAVAAARLDDDFRPGRLRPFDRSVARAAVHDDRFVDALRGKAFPGDASGKVDKVDAPFRFLGRFGYRRNQRR